MSNKEIGNLGEKTAVNYLIKEQYQILETNYSTRFGEIDIIAQKDDTIIFVEVKTRKNELFGSPAEAVSFRKQEKIKRCAIDYYSKLNKDIGVSFDIIEIIASVFNGIFKVKSINHIKNAF